MSDVDGPDGDEAARLAAAVEFAKTGIIRGLTRLGTVVVITERLQGGLFLVHRPTYLDDNGSHAHPSAIFLTGLAHKPSGSGASFEVMIGSDPYVPLAILSEGERNRIFDMLGLDSVISSFDAIMAGLGSDPNIDDEC